MNVIEADSLNEFRGHQIVETLEHRTGLRFEYSREQRSGQVGSHLTSSHPRPDWGLVISLTVKVSITLHLAIVFGAEKNYLHYPILLMWP